MSHAVIPGVVLALYCGDPLAIGAFVTGLFCAIAALTIWTITGHQAYYGRDGRRLSGMFGAGLVLYVSIQSEVHLDHILFGEYAGRCRWGYRTNVSCYWVFCVNHGAEMEEISCYTLLTRTGRKPRAEYQAAIIACCCMIARYRRHAEIGGHYSVDLTIPSPRHNLPFAWRRFCARAG